LKLSHKIRLNYPAVSAGLRKLTVAESHFLTFGSWVSKLRDWSLDSQWPPFHIIYAWHHHLCLLLVLSSCSVWSSELNLPICKIVQNGFKLIFALDIVPWTVNYSLLQCLWNVICVPSATDSSGTFLKIKLQSQT
jgi:hypothetical protein